MALGNRVVPVFMLRWPVFFNSTIYLVLPLQMKSVENKLSILAIMNQLARGIKVS